MRDVRVCAKVKINQPLDEAKLNALHHMSLAPLPPNVLFVSLQDLLAGREFKPNGGVWVDIELPPYAVKSYFASIGK